MHAYTGSVHAGCSRADLLCALEQAYPGVDDLAWQDGGFECAKESAHTGQLDRTQQTIRLRLVKFNSLAVQLAGSVYWAASHKICIEPQELAS